jgi:branched-chain amino acid transport system ATP-binding protein
MTALLALDRVTVRRASGLALRACSLALQPGRALAVLGANGAGKSTLMQAVIGLVPVSSGEIRFRGDAIERRAPELRARSGIGYCPEGRRVFPGLTVQENLEMACWADRRERPRRLDAAFTLFPPLAGIRGSPAWQLSGGQQQMLAIARAMMNAPALLLLDEPSIGLAPALAERVLAAVPAIRDAGTAIMLAEQNAKAALRVCDEAVLLRNGIVVEAGPAASLAESDAVRQAFLGA